MEPCGNQRAMKLGPRRRSLKQGSVNWLHLLTAIANWIRLKQVVSETAGMSWEK